MHILKKSRHRLGFSLPEVTIAVAIASLGITSTMGLLPKGIETLKKAGDTASQSRIAQQIVGTLSVAEWNDSAGDDILDANYNGASFYYDDMAVLLSTQPAGSGAAPPPLAVYVAQVSIQTPDINLPQSSGTPVTDAFLRRVLIRVGPVGISPSALALNSTASPQVTTFSSVISQDGQ